MQTDNKALYAINDGAERSILLLWSVTVLVASLTGDSIILVATIKYKAIKLHKVTVDVIKHLAICDLLQTLFRVLPVTLALITDSWITGEVLCHVEDNINYFCTGLTMILTCTMSTLKLLLVKYPLRTRSSQLGNKVCVFVWVLMLAGYTPILAVNMIYLRETLYFSYWDYNCNYDDSSTTGSVPAWYQWYCVICYFSVNIVSYTTLVVTSILLLVIAKKTAGRHGEGLRWEGVSVVLVTVGVFLVSYLPWVVVTGTWILGVQYHHKTWRAMYHLQYLNIMANFFVYALTVRSFREFLKLRMAKLLSMMRSRSTDQRTNVRQGPSPALQDKGHNNTSCETTRIPRASTATE